MLFFETLLNEDFWEEFEFLNYIGFQVYNLKERPASMFLYSMMSQYNHVTMVTDVIVNY